TIRTLCGNQQYMYCNAPMRLELADGRQIWMRAGSRSTTCQGAATDLSDIQALPASQVVWARELMGEGTVVTGNSAMIVDTINAHNKKFAAEELISPTTGAAGSVGGSTGAAGTSGISNGGGGCSCSLGDAGANAPFFVALGGVLVVVIARRRR